MKLRYDESLVHPKKKKKKKVTQKVTQKVTLPRIELREPTNIDRQSKHLDYNTDSLVACLNIFIGQIIGGTAEINNWEYNKMPLPRIEQGTRIIDTHT